MIKRGTLQTNDSFVFAGPDFPEKLVHLPTRKSGGRKITKGHGRLADVLPCRVRLFACRLWILTVHVLATHFRHSCHLADAFALPGKTKTLAAFMPAWKRKSERWVLCEETERRGLTLTGQMQLVPAAALRDAGLDHIVSL